jgi:hypothetical protein
VRYMTRPFRFGLNGRVVTADENSDELIASRLYAALTTRAADGETPGERPLTPGYGTADPVGHGLTVEAVRACVAQYGPPGVTIVGLDSTYPDDATQQATLHWQRDDDGEGT